MANFKKVDLEYLKVCSFQILVNLFFDTYSYTNYLQFYLRFYSKLCKLLLFVGLRIIHIIFVCRFLILLQCL